jgi:hypothetical protein
VASSLLAALLAVGVVLGFVLVRTGRPSSSSNHSAATTTSVPSGPTTTIPSVSPRTTSVPTTTSAPARPVVPVPTAAPPPGLCTPAEVIVTTSTDESSYATGSTVTVTTLLRALRSCVFQPVAAGPYSCADTIVITDGAGSQVWPAPGEREVCSPPAGAVLQPGATETLRGAWNQVVDTSGHAQQAPPGPYQAAGTWNFSAGPGRPPYEVSARSAPFAIE